MIISASQEKMVEVLINDEDQEIQSPEFEVRHMVVPAELHKERLDRILAYFIPEFSRNYLQKLVADGAVCINQQIVTKSSVRVAIYQTIDIELRPTPDVLAFRPENVPLDILYEDAHVLVLNKPAGLVVHPGAGNWSGTVLNGLLAHDPQAAHLPRAGIVHRLDKDTSGLMIVGRTLQACTELVKMFALKDVRREYIALAQGQWPAAYVNQPREIDAPIGRDPRSRIKMAVIEGGKVAKTTVTLYAGNSAYSLIRCQLHTGRTHQIRVHMAYIGYPLVGDLLYGGKALCGMSRQALHAFKLSFKHPISGEIMVFEQSCPADFVQAVKMGEISYNLP